MIILSRYYQEMKTHHETGPNRDPQNQVREILYRISRITASEDWAGDINPTQRAALSYLARANRFSRSPSQVADYLEATRGTVSQTLKALARKDLIEEQRSEQDKRSISYAVTDEGHATLNFRTAIDQAVGHLTQEQADDLALALTHLMSDVLQARGGRSFGVCGTCRHHQTNPSGAYCVLLQEALVPAETEQICHEHAVPA